MSKAPTLEGLGSTLSAIRKCTRVRNSINGGRGAGRRSKGINKEIQTSPLRDREFHRSEKYSI